MKAQDKHIPQYYAQLEFLPVPIAIYKLLLKSTSKVHIAIDRGAVPLILKGSMGFVIADEEGTALRTNMLWTTIRQGPIIVLIRNIMCNPILAAIRLVTLLTN